MKQQNPYVVQEGDDNRSKKRASAKGKGKGKRKASSNEEEDEDDEAEDGEDSMAIGEKESGAGPSNLEKGKGSDAGAAKGSQGGGRGQGMGSKGAVSESAGPLVLRIPVPAQGTFPPKADSVIRALQAKVQRLERDLGKESDKTEDLRRLANEVQRLERELSTEEERTANLVAGKEKYKGMVRDMQAEAVERIRILEAAVEEGEAGRLELQRKLDEASAGVGAELGRLRPAVEEYLREKAEYLEWRDTGVRRMELAQELARAEEDRKQLRLRVLGLEREQKEYEQRRRDQEEELEDLEGELGAVLEQGEAAQARVLKLVQSSEGKEYFLLSCNSV